MGGANMVRAPSQVNQQDDGTTDKKEMEREKVRLDCSHGCKMLVISNLQCNDLPRKQRILFVNDTYLRSAPATSQNVLKAQVLQQLS